MYGYWYLSSFHVHKTSLIPLLFIEVPVSNHKMCGHVVLYIYGLDILFWNCSEVVVFPLLLLLIILFQQMINYIVNPAGGRNPGQI